MKTRASRLVSTSLAVLASSLALASFGCADQEAGFWVANVNSPKDEMGETVCTTGDPTKSVITLSTSDLNARGVLFECIEFQTGLARPDQISSVPDDTDPWAIILDRAEIDLLRAGVPVESFDFTLTGRVLSGVEGDPHYIPVASAATAASLGGSLAAGEALQLDVEIRAFGHTAGGLEVETPPYRIAALYYNQ